jgi:uncharacterized protein (UPF0335 family)
MSEQDLIEQISRLEKENKRLAQGSKRYELLRKATPKDFSLIYKEARAGQSFDSLVDDLQ